MGRAHQRRMGRGMKARRANVFKVAIALVAVAVAAFLLAPSFAGGVGRLVGGLWVTVMGAVVGLIGGMFGA